MKSKKTADTYEDIINLEHHTSKKHPNMSITDRAAQFSPFAALTGHEEALKETERLTDYKIELEDELKDRLDEKIKIIIDKIEQKPEITITYYIPDEKKSGGKYAEETGCIVKIDSINGNIYMDNGKKIKVEDIIDLDSNIF